MKNNKNNILKINFSKNNRNEHSQENLTTERVITSSTQQYNDAINNEFGDGGRNYGISVASIKSSGSKLRKNVQKMMKTQGISFKPKVLDLNQILEEQQLLSQDRWRSNVVQDLRKTSYNYHSLKQLPTKKNIESPDIQPISAVGLHIQGSLTPVTLDPSTKFKSRRKLQQANEQLYSPPSYFNQTTTKIPNITNLKISPDRHGKSNAKVETE